MDALEHGKLNTYVNRRCRCLDCQAASRAYGRELYRRRAYGRVVELVDVDQVRTHLRWLAGHGIGWEQIPQLADVGRNTVDQILRPTRRRRGVTPRIAAAILGVLPTLTNAAAGALIDSAGTRRRLQALMLTGHTLTAIQEATGASALGRVLTRDTVTAVRPLEKGVRIHLEDVEDLARFGATWKEIERRTGACRNSIEVACGRADRPDLVVRITSNRWVAA